MNHFARFGLEPRPWVDPEVLKETFLKVSARVHPDKTPGADREFQELNEAYKTLRQTRTRLLYLLELAGEPRAEHVQSVPPAAIELFPKVAEATKRADSLAREKAAAHSPMLKVGVLERCLEETDSIQALQGELRGRIEQIEARVREMAWPVPPLRQDLAGIRDAAAALGFLERWNAQLQERLGTLTF